MRRFLQALSLLLFSAFFVFATYRLPDWLPADIYLRLDPLLGLNAIFAAREIIGRALWSLITIGITLVVGRFFCAYVCPMGASIDFSIFFLFRKKKRQGLKSEASLRKAKYSLLIIFIIAALTGLSLAFLMDPIALLTRFYTFFIYPLAITLINLIFDLLRPLVSSPRVGNLISPPLFPVCLLYDGHHPPDLWRDHCPQSSRPTFLVPLSLPIGSFSQLGLASWAFQT